MKSDHEITHYFMKILKISKNLRYSINNIITIPVFKDCDSTREQIVHLTLHNTNLQENKFEGGNYDKRNRIRK